MFVEPARWFLSAFFFKKCHKILFNGLSSAFFTCYIWNCFTSYLIVVTLCAKGPFDLHFAGEEIDVQRLRHAHCYNRDRELAARIQTQDLGPAFIEDQGHHG